MKPILPYGGDRTALFQFCHSAIKSSIKDGTLETREIVDDPYQFCMQELANEFKFYPRTSVTSDEVLSLLFEHASAHYINKWIDQEHS